MTLMPGRDSERVDAARNRSRVLDAAAELVAKRGVENLTMDELAKTAGVGKGTVFRRFGSRSGLMHALLDHQEREFQTAFMFGPPPLGPGAPAAERLRAFGGAVIARLDVDGPLLRAVAAPGDAYYSHPTQKLVRQQLTHLLKEAGAVGDVEMIGYQLACCLNAGLLLHLRHEREMSLERLVLGWESLVGSVVGPEP
ncbi:TetR/AcrR family transcriptional regulator [Arthrobacter sp. H5]|uniref:TetR/AcrR family transcriptional regulator n=1 Tax=Arthrobacter sp. H5 TaxID=1267973 RepID=UPI0004804073|nr:TetR/AcrR family transcriptional regulator [Arthrobacter sp. H5]